MPSAGFAVAEYVCPTIAAVLSTLTFAAPVKSLKSCINSGSLGSLNPTPWAFMTGTTLGWLAYSYITADLFVFFANAPGLLISIWLNVGAVKLQYHDGIVEVASVQSAGVPVGGAAGASEIEGQITDEDENNGDGNIPRRRAPSSFTPHECKVLQILILWMAILSATSLLPIGEGDAKLAVGVAVNLNQIFFYAAPLSTVLTIVRTKSSASIHVWTMVMNTSNNSFWCIYSIAVRDYYILIPNGLGLLFGIIQMMLFKCYPRSGIDDADITARLLHDDDENSKANSKESQTEIV